MSFQPLPQNIAFLSCSRDMADAAALMLSQRFRARVE
jgi:hypothetical protein